MWGTSTNICQQGRVIDLTGCWGVITVTRPDVPVTLGCNSDDSYSSSQWVDVTDDQGNPRGMQMYEVNVTARGYLDYTQYQLDIVGSGIEQGPGSLLEQEASDGENYHFDGRVKENASGGDVYYGENVGGGDVYYDMNENGNPRDYKEENVSGGNVYYDQGGNGSTYEVGSEDCGDEEENFGGGDVYYES